VTLFHDFRVIVLARIYSRADRPSLHSICRLWNQDLFPGFLRVSIMHPFPVTRTICKGLRPRLAPRLSYSQSRESARCKFCVPHRMRDVLFARDNPGSTGCLRPVRPRKTGAAPVPGTPQLRTLCRAPIGARFICGPLVPPGRIVLLAARLRERISKWVFCALLLSKESRTSGVKGKCIHIYCSTF
jgi:hypothetical protein